LRRRLERLPGCRAVAPSFLKAQKSVKIVPMSWEPLLTGDLAEQADLAVSAISEALQGPLPDVNSYSLSAGHSGVALFFGYLSLARSEEKFADLASEHLSQAVDSVAADPSPALGLFSGLSGLGWTWHHLSQILGEETDASATAELDEIILEAVRATPWEWDWDLISGLAGIGLYALSHPEPSFAEEAARQVVDRLAELAIECPTGIAWRTEAGLMTPTNAKAYPAGRFDQGVAHGVPGVIGFLGATYERGIAREQTRALLDGALAWMSANMRPDDGGSRFTYYPPVMDDARSGWCYGDPGVSAVLLRTGGSVGDKPCRDLAVCVACRTACRPFERTGVVDATLCHGTAGLGHLFNRAFQATGEEGLRKAATAWFHRTLEMRRPGKGVGGFLNWWPEIKEWRGESGFLVGSAGIALALLSALYPIEPRWDMPFLLPTAKAPTARCV
jgi:lantibiotic biosynthesis protein